MARTESTEAVIAVWEARIAQLEAEGPPAEAAYEHVYWDQIRLLQGNIAGARHYVKLAEQIDAAGPYTVAESHVGGVTLHFQRGKVTLLHGSYEPRGAH